MGTSNAAMWLALFILGFIWGSSFILMKLALFDTSGAPLFPALDVAMGLSLSLVGPFARRAETQQASQPQNASVVDRGRRRRQLDARLPLHHSPNPHPLLRRGHAQRSDADVHISGGGGAVWD